MKQLRLVLVALMLVACENNGAHLVGTLERDRITLLAERSEPVIAVHANEGERVEKGELILELDPSRALAERERLAALMWQAERRVDELVRGPREESIREARARLASAEGLLENAKNEYGRLQQLRSENLASVAALDAARAQRDARQGDYDAARAALQVLLEGTTVEELDQARAELDATRAALHIQELIIERLSVEAPRDGRIEAIPFERGAQPSAGAEVVILLAEGAPYARTYIPAAWREQFSTGSKVTVHVPGFGNFPGQVRWVSASAAFTPYFALTEHDRDRLSYAAEIDLSGEAAAKLPAGLPVEVFAAKDETQ
ncbi:MAG TPA: HlyD family efflux transporter periplasmic adaptor subunit [Gammaproteobacteria bacterium]